MLLEEKQKKLRREPLSYWNEKILPLSVVIYVVLGTISYLYWTSWPRAVLKSWNAFKYYFKSNYMKTCLHCRRSSNSYLTIFALSHDHNICNWEREGEREKEREREDLRQRYLVYVVQEACICVFMCFRCVLQVFLYCVCQSLWGYMRREKLKVILRKTDENCSIA